MPTDSSTRRSITIFYSYSHRDERFRSQLENHLSLLKRRGLINDWQDRKIEPGEHWAAAINASLEAADLILLLVSADFIASDYCWGKEMTRAIERHEAGTARVVPIIIRPTDWSGAPFGRLQALPKDGKPLTLWANRDSAWLDVARGIGKLAEAVAAGRPIEGSPASPAPVPAATVAPAPAPAARELAPTGPRKGGRLRRLVYDAEHSSELPGRLAREEGGPPAGNASVDETYDGLGHAYAFFWDVFERDSVDGAGLPLEASVRYEQNYNNAFWDGKRVILGDGDGRLFNRFTLVDVIGKELSNAVVQQQTRLTYWGESGALFDSIAVVLACLIKQYALKQTAEQADWLLGAGIFGPAVRARGLQSLANPGTAYNDPALGKDPQPSHMRDYVKTHSDNAGVHVNGGIPNHAFYLAAIMIGGHAWEKAGRIWYQAVRDGRLRKDSGFAHFARLTTEHAEKMFGEGSAESNAVTDAWHRVGIDIRKAARRRRPASAH